ncbi:eggshell protein-like [Melanaphis sacchari]|uniref:eggshell protein-like n=1 Tax=Melanaphis sacchari TaxID=742174 RepID=UPI000DC15275|nr:eggshell protein-like [Melanaphis sacchari]XP_025194107.1 eggshell protein-like [Melanaphis sacchari]
MCGCGSSKVEKDSTYGDGEYKNTKRRRQNHSIVQNYYGSNTYSTGELSDRGSYYNSGCRDSGGNCDCFGSDGGGDCYDGDGGGDCYGGDGEDNCICDCGSGG